MKRTVISVNNWTTCKISDICSSISDTYKRTDEYVVLVNTSDVLEGKILNHIPTENKNLKGQFKKTFRKNDILYSEIRPANKRFAFVDIENTDNYIASTKLMVLRCDETKVLPKFLFSLLKSSYIINELQLLAETRSGTFPQITFSGELGPMEINLPDFETQHKIVSILDSLEDKIQINNEINSNLEQQAQAIFDKYLNLQELPEGWVSSNLLDIADYINGLAMQKYRPVENETGLPVLKIKELRQGCCDANSELCSENINPNYIISNGDVIFSWSGSLLVDFWCGGKCGLNQHLFKVSSSKYDKWFYYAWTKHHLNRFIAIASDMATTMGHIKREELSKAVVFIPTDEEYRHIGSLLEPIYDAIISNRLENNHLASVRDSLLPKLMSGEIDLSNIDI